MSAVLRIGRSVSNTGASCEVFSKRIASQMCWTTPHRNHFLDLLAGPAGLARSVHHPALQLGLLLFRPAQFLDVDSLRSPDRPQFSRPRGGNDRLETGATPFPVFSSVSSSMSLAASGSKWNAANSRISGRGVSVRASSQAASTGRCSSGACSGPNDTATVLGCLSVVSPSAFRHRVAPSGSKRRVDINHLDLARETLLFEQRIHDRQAIAGDKAVGPPVAVTNPTGGLFVRCLSVWA